MEISHRIVWDSFSVQAHMVQPLQHHCVTISQHS